MPATMPALTNGGGTAFAMPDVCLTPAPPSPPVPVPYPNTGQLSQASKTSNKVKIKGKKVITVASEVPRTMGDEAGINKGVMSGMNMDKVTFKKGSSKVKAEGKAVCYLGSVTGHNGTNANNPMGAAVAPSQTGVLVSV
jgi:hypothetical protein